MLPMGIVSGRLRIVGGHKRSHWSSLRRGARAALDSPGAGQLLALGLLGLVIAQLSPDLVGCKKPKWRNAFPHPNRD